MGSEGGSSRAQTSEVESDSGRHSSRLRSSLPKSVPDLGKPNNRSGRKRTRAIEYVSEDADSEEDDREVTANGKEIATKNRQRGPVEQTRPRKRQKVEKVEGQPAKEARPIVEAMVKEEEKMLDVPKPRSGRGRPRNPPPTHHASDVEGSSDEGGEEEKKDGEHGGESEGESDEADDAVGSSRRLRRKTKRGMAASGESSSEDEGSDYGSDLEPPLKKQKLESKAKAVAKRQKPKPKPKPIPKSKPASASKATPSSVSPSVRRGTSAISPDSVPKRKTLNSLSLEAPISLPYRSQHRRRRLRGPDGRPTRGRPRVGDASGEEDEDEDGDDEDDENDLPVFPTPLFEQKQPEAEEEAPIAEAPAANASQDAIHATPNDVQIQKLVDKAPPPPKRTLLELVLSLSHDHL